MKNLLRSVLAVFMVAASAAHAGSLPVPLEPQQTQLWCWAASASMIMHYLGASSVSQCDEANRRLDRTDCCNSPVPAACVMEGWPEFEKYGFSATTSGALSWSSLVNEINNNRPVVFSWGWTGGGGHLMVARGYTSTRTDNLVDVNDPWGPNVGDQYLLSYSEYVSGSDHVHWTDFYNIHNNTSSVQGYPLSQVSALGDHLEAQALEELPQLITQANHRSLGFEAPEEARSSKLSEPIPVFMIRLDELQRYGGEEPGRLLTDVQRSVFPIEVAGQVRSTVEMQAVNGQWRMARIGGAQKIRAMDKQRRSTMASRSLRSSDFFEVRIPALNRVFLGHHDAEGLMLTPLVDDDALALKAGISEPANKVLARLVPEARATPTDMP